MHTNIDPFFLEYIHSPRHPFSIEVFPPNTEEKTKKLMCVLHAFVDLGVQSINITCKPGNSSFTLALSRRIREELPSVMLIPHIAAFSFIAESLETLLDNYMSLGISNVFLIRGDLPDTVYKEQIQSTHAQVLVERVRNHAKDLCIGVAAYPEQHFEEPNFISAMQYLKQKVDAGADYIITQLFFDNNKYFDFVRSCALFGIDVPILPGITYLKNKQHIEKISSLALGTSFPYPLLRDVYQDNNEHALKRGIAWCTQQSKELLKKGAATQVHFYIFNDSNPFTMIMRSMKDTICQ